MRLVLRATTFILVGWLSAIGCAENKAASVDAPGEPAAGGSPSANAFLPGSGILSGFDPAEPTGEWRVGDRLLLGFQIDQHGRQSVRFILIEAKSRLLPLGTDVTVIGPADAPPPETEPAEAASARIALPPAGTTPTTASAPASAAAGEEKAGAASKGVYIRLAEGDDSALIGYWRGRVWWCTMTETTASGGEQSASRLSSPVFVAITVYDEAGGKIKTAGTIAPATYLRNGFFKACDRVRGGRGGSKEDEAAMAIALTDLIPSLYGIGEVIGGTPVLARIIQPIVPRPSLWSVLTSGAPDINLKIESVNLSEDERPLPALAGGRRAYLVPLAIELKGEPGLRCRLSVTDASPPFHLCGGVAGIDGYQVKDPSCKFSMRLLAARRAGE